MTMTQTSLVYMAHWLVFRTSGLEQRDSAALFSGSFINTDSSEGTLNNAKIEDIDRKKKKTTTTTTTTANKNKNKKPTTAHLFSTRDAPAVASSENA